MSRYPVLPLLELSRTATRVRRLTLCRRRETRECPNLRPPHRQRPYLSRSVALTSSRSAAVHQASQLPTPTCPSSGSMQSDGRYRLHGIPCPQELPRHDSCLTKH